MRELVGIWCAAYEAEARDALQLDPLGNELFPVEQARIVQLLVRRVAVTADGIAVDVRAEGISGVIREMLAPAQMEAAE